MPDKIVDKLTKQYDDSVNAELKSSIDYHFEQLVIKPRSEVSSLRESVFVQAFLPFFLGEVSFEERENILVQWVAIAGAPTKEVKIVDENNNFLFSVPALFDTTCIDFKNDGQGQKISSIIANYELHKLQLPVVGKNYLNKGIDDRLKTLTKESEVLTSNINRWNEIFVRYGKVKKETPQEEKVEKLGDDEIIYD